MVYDPVAQLHEAERLIGLAELQERFGDADDLRRSLLIPVLYTLRGQVTDEPSIRQALWLNHGHGPALYGDDGEMQCHACLPVWDYRRAPLADIVSAALAALSPDAQARPPVDAATFIAELKVSDPDTGARFDALYRAEEAHNQPS